MSKKQKSVVTGVTIPATNTTAASTVDLATMTPEQLAALQKQLRQLRKADEIDHEKWNVIVDAMLMEREGDGFRHTTSDILAAVQANGLVKMTLTTEERANHLKKVQTRKQLLEKKRDDKGNLIYQVGYKPSVNSFGPLTIGRIVEWLSVPANVETVTVAQADSIMAAIKHIV